MKKKNCRVFEIICYVAAALVAVTGLYMLWANIAYIGEYLSAYGMGFGDMKGQIIQTVAPVLAQYLTYTLVLVGMGRIYHAVKGGIVYEEDLAEPEVFAADECEEVSVEAVEAAEEEAEEAAVETAEPVEAPVEIADEAKED